MIHMLMLRWKKFWMFTFIVTTSENFWYAGRDIHRKVIPGNQKKISIAKIWSTNSWKRLRIWKMSHWKNYDRFDRKHNGSHWWHREMHAVYQSATRIDNGKQKCFLSGTVWIRRRRHMPQRHLEIFLYISNTQCRRFTIKMHGLTQLITSIHSEQMRKMILFQWILFKHFFKKVATCMDS